jgi:rubrerythrin
MNIPAFLDEAIALEETIAACYGELAKRTALPDVSGVFHKLKGDEDNHVGVLRTGKDFARRAPDLFGKETIDPASLKKGLASTVSLLDDLRASRVELREAVVRLRDLESRFEQIHLSTIVAVNDASLADLFRQLSRDDRVHRITLEEILNSPELF